MLFGIKTIVLVFALASSATFADEPPPIELLRGELKSAPYNQPDYKGPPIGIIASPYKKGRITGVLVEKDNTKRDLWYLFQGTERKKAKFAPGRDIILKVNDFPVRSSAEILSHTEASWNKLLIKDLKDGNVGEYWVKLAGPSDDSPEPE